MSSAAPRRCKKSKRGGGKARFIAADLNDADDVRRLAAESGPVDILINNAGVYKFGATAETDDVFFDEHININLRAPYILVQQLAPGMAERGNGVVVNLSTIAAGVPARQGGIYGATKAGIELLTRVWADEFGRSGVRVNAVQAGPTETPGTAVTPGLTDGLGQLTTLGRAAVRRRNRQCRHVRGLPRGQLHQRRDPAGQRRPGRDRPVIAVGALEGGNQLTDVATPGVGRPYHPRAPHQWVVDQRAPGDGFRKGMRPILRRQCECIDPR